MQLAADPADLRTLPSIVPNGHTSLPVHSGAPKEVQMRGE
jgi:hypothetical protein